MAKPRTFNYDDAPKGRSIFPKMYANVEIDTAKREHGDYGTYFALEGRIVKPHADGTAAYDGMPVFINFNVGHEDDPDAEDPKTWTKENDVIQSRIAVQDMISFLMALGLTKGEGRGTHPADLFEDAEGKKLTVFFGQRVAKKGARKGDTFQSYTFYPLGEREPQLLNAAEEPAPRRRAAETEDEDEPAPARKGRAVEAEEDEDETPAPRRRR